MKTMKKIFTLLISLLLLNGSLSNKELRAESIISPGDSIIVLSTPDLYNTSVKWAGEYNRLYPEMKIKIISIPDSKQMDKLLAEGKIAFVSNEYYSGFNSQTLWRVVVGRDVIVPVINSKNPFSAEICRRGITQSALSQFCKNTKSPDWGTLLNNSEKTPVNYYWVNEESLQTGIADFLNTDKVKINGKEVKTGEEMIEAIKKDPNGLGFCKMISIMDTRHQNIVENIRLLPIDRNGNGIIDYNEKIYDDFNAFSRGIWIGKYPKTLFSNIYTISAKQPKKESEVAFLKWVVTDGQQFLYKDGYSDLAINERQTTVEKLNNAEANVPAIAVTSSLTRAILLILAIIIASGLIVDVSFRYLKRRKASMLQANAGSKPILDENSVVVPNGIYFDKTHTWAFMEQNGVVKVGIDDFLQHITGPITRIKMKNQGKVVKKGDPILSIIQNGKQLNLYSPVSGTIIEQNKVLDNNSSIINSSPYTDGWIYKIEPTNWHRENQLLFIAEKQKELIKIEFSRLKDFLVTALREDKVLHAMTVLQDGGELRDGVLTNMGPEVWEEFQTQFIDASRQLWFYEIF
jgi:glycine cleavage system H lipoate-binding protein/ABC-type phosphate transport system substrate-binding protein